MKKSENGTFTKTTTPYTRNLNLSESRLCMTGKIYTDEKCPACHSKLTHNETLRGFVCNKNPQHALVHPKNCRVKFGRNIAKRFSNHRYLEALQFLDGLRYKTIEGSLDHRDFQKENPLGFESQAMKWLEIKKKITKLNTYRNLKRDIYKAVRCWGQDNIKTIGYADIEDFLFSLPVGAKTRYNTWSCIHDFFSWAAKREKIPMPDMPDCSNFELGWRTIIDLQTQQEVLDKIKDISWI
jgi:hypothetical protein